MTYIIFATEAQAIAAEAKATANCRAFVKQVAPDRLTPDGDLVCVNAATGQLDPTAQTVKRWAIPQQYAEGWAFPLPEPQQIAPIPLDAFMAGVGGTPADQLTPLPAPEVEP